MIIIQKNFTGGNNRSTEYQVFGHNESLPHSKHNQSVTKPDSSNSSGDDWSPEYSNQELDPHKQVLDFVNKNIKKAEEERKIAEQQKALSPQKAYERTAINAVNPSRKEKMISLHQKHTIDENVQKTLEGLKNNNWNVNIPSKENSTVETEANNDSAVVNDNKTEAAQPTEQKVEIKHTPKKDQPAIEYKPESTSPNELDSTDTDSTAQVSPDTSEKGLSNGAKAGLAVAGAAALTAGGYAAYKALKKRAAKKKAEKAEVDKFLNEKYNTKQ